MEQAIDRIINDYDCSELKAKKIFNATVEEVYCIIALYKYYEWALLRGLKDYDVGEINILERKPYYKKDPVLNISASHIVQLSKRSLFREFARETGCKYTIEQVMFCETNEISALNRVLTKIKEDNYAINYY